MAVAAHITGASSAPNVVSLNLPPVPKERWNFPDHDLRALPAGVVALHDPGPTLDDQVRAVLTPEMEAINALISALDRRTPSGKRSSASVRTLVYDELSKTREAGRFNKTTKALERLITMKWWEQR